ncbi:MAG: leucine-rich repeat protein [Treponema sp.]|jgi:hypothetical protein|nr:leucine-rich repeat protein [Treponema sp.]
MATFGYRVFISWKGDEDRGKEMERIVGAAFKGLDADDDFLDEGIDREQVKTLRKEISERMYRKIPITKEFDECRLFGDYEEKRTAYFQWEENQNFAEDCFAPLFGRFPGVDFWFQFQRDYVSSDDSYDCKCIIYENGSVAEERHEEYDSYDEYLERCEQETRERLEWLGLPPEEEQPAITNTDFKIINGTILEEYTGKDGAVVVPDGVQVIQEGAFRGKKITSLYLSSSVRSIGGDHISSAFWGGQFYLKTIEVSEQNNDYSGIEGILYDKAVKTLLCCPAGSELTEAHIPNTVKKIADYAFDTCEKLISVHIPDSVRSIGKAAFCACTGLRSIFISDTPRKIGKEAFEGCASLDEETCRKLRKWGYEGMITQADALDFVRKNPEQFNDIPIALRTRDVCLLGVKERGGVCKLIPKALQSEDFFIEAVTVNINGKALKYVPDEYRTLKVCAAAVKKFPDALEFVPEALKGQVKKAAKIK